MHHSAKGMALHQLMQENDAKEGESLKKHSPKFKVTVVEHHGDMNAAAPGGKDMTDEPIVALMEKLLGKSEAPSEEGTPADEADDEKLKKMAMHLKGK